MRISEINIYPIKSLKGISLESAVVEPRGLRYDRRWMLTTPDGMFFTQREFPKMATISVSVESGQLKVECDGAGEMLVPFEPDKGERRQVTIWRSVCEGLVYDGAVSEWFSDAIGTDCRLVYMPKSSKRNVNPLFNKNDDLVSFADGYPLMLLGEASLAELNRRLAENVGREDAGGMGAPSDKTHRSGAPAPAVQSLPMNRFRPNLVVAGSEAFAEDDWGVIRVGEAVFRSTKPCERCVITTIDQAAGEKTGKEPLKTLATFRLAKTVMPDRVGKLGVDPSAVLFGQNLIPENPGATVRVGDKIQILQQN